MDPPMANDYRVFLSHVRMNPYLLAVLW